MNRRNFLKSLGIAGMALLLSSIDLTPPEEPLVIDWKDSFGTLRTNDIDMGVDQAIVDGDYTVEAWLSYTDVDGERKVAYLKDKDIELCDLRPGWNHITVIHDRKGTRVHV